MGHAVFENMGKTTDFRQKKIRVSRLKWKLIGLLCCQSLKTVLYSGGNYQIEFNTT